MKKFIMALVCLMTMVVLTSCGSTYEVTANYDVCYPDGTRNYDYKNIFKNSTEPSVICYSNGGTNYLSIGRVIRKSTTAPIRLNSFNVRKLTKKTYIEDIYMKDIIGH
jgi:hypothetical protein